MPRFPSSSTRNVSLRRLTAENQSVLLLFSKSREILCVVTSTRAAAEAEWRRLECGEKPDNVLS